jgi:hypothetical protein
MPVTVARAATAHIAAGAPLLALIHCHPIRSYTIPYSIAWVHL